MRRLAVLLLGLCLAGVRVDAQPATAVVERPAPIYPKSTDTRVPLRTAAPGTTLRVLTVDGGWVNVEFRDPQVRRPRRVRIIDRRSAETNYSYVVPGQFSQHTDANASCTGFLNTANCNASATTRGTVAPPQRISYNVSGATFTLRLPDQRLVVVNCDSKYKLRGDFINRRSCRVPLVDHIVVEFKGDDANLFWAVSIDGSKSQSEMYKILGVLGP